MIAVEDVIGELHQSSVALLTALRGRSPLFLEHLERRGRALLALRSLPACPGDVPLLLAVVAAGEAASMEAQFMRQESVNALNQLQSQRLFSRGLSAGTEPHRATLDVKA